MAQSEQPAQERWTVRAIQTSATALNDKPGIDYAIARWGGAPSPVLYSISLACANRIADELNAALEARAEADRQRIAELEMERDNLKRDISWRSEVALTEQHRAEAAEAERDALKARAELADEVLGEDGLRWALCADEAGVCSACGERWSTGKHQPTCVIARYDALTDPAASQEEGS